MFHSYVYNVAVNYHHYSCHIYIYRIVPYNPIAPIRWHVTELDLRSTLASVCKKVTRLMNWIVDLISLQLVTITFIITLLSLLPHHHYYHFHQWFLPPQSPSLQPSLILLYGHFSLSLHDFIRTLGHSWSKRWWGDTAEEEESATNYWRGESERRFGFGIGQWRW